MSLFGLSKKDKEEIHGMFLKAVEESILKLNPNARYILLIPEDNIEEVERVAKDITESLDLPNSNLRLTILAGTNIKLLEIN